MGGQEGDTAARQAPAPNQAGWGGTGSGRPPCCLLSCTVEGGAPGWQRAGHEHEYVSGRKHDLSLGGSDRCAWITQTPTGRFECNLWQCFPRTPRTWPVSSYLEDLCLINWRVGRRTRQTLLHVSSFSLNSFDFIGSKLERPECKERATLLTVCHGYL